MKTAFNIGDELWLASTETVEEKVKCPECGGTRILTVTLFNGTEHTIDCAGCSRGYHPPTGWISIYEHKAKLTPITVIGVEVAEKNLEEYRVKDGPYTRICRPDRLTRTHDEGKEVAARLARELSKEQREKVERKEKDTRTWAWNVHYYRKEIREARRRLEYYMAKLEAGRPKATAERKKKKKS